MANISDGLDVVPETDVAGPVVGVALQLALDPVHDRRLVYGRAYVFWPRA